MTLSFTKVEGLGNDFLLFDSRKSKHTFTAEQARSLCDRHRGPGADGVLTLLPSERAAARMRIQNADGSDSEMCGNGLRCAALLLAGPEAGRTLTVETSTGVHRCRIEGDGSVWVELVGLTDPRVIQVSLGGVMHAGYTVSLGNPHFVLLRPAGPGEAAVLGAALEHHPHFAPERTNVEFADHSASGLRVQVWERGVGLTLACGTGAVAAVVAARAAGLLAGNGPFQVDLPGGAVFVDLAADARSAGLRGPARQVFVGQLDMGVESL
jgi:diaminopimelate epimerase